MTHRLRREEWNGGIILRLAVLLALLIAAAAVPAFRRANFPQAAPSGYGVAIGYGLGGARELDALGPVWYMDYEHTGATYSGHRRFLMVKAVWDDLSRVPQAARTNPGAWWQFGNEPNDPNQDNLTPERYAVAYHNFYFMLKRIDPAARIVPAGLANADWKWADAFREAYRARFGRYPPADGWNIHDYLLDRCDQALDFEEFKSRILAFRGWMMHRGEAEKPLFLTEYGVLYGSGCCSCPAIPLDQALAFMRATSKWLESQRAVAAWAWFAVSSGGRFNGDLFAADWNLAPFGVVYRQLVAAAGR